MRENFDAALAVIFKVEGGDSDHPEDSGGFTRYGITASVAHQHGYNIRTLTRADAEIIYRLAYWDALWCDYLPAGLDLMVFDCAVNQGPGTAAKLLQRSIGAKVDGIVGEKTIAASKEKDDAVNEMMARRMRRYGRSPRFVFFGLGWSRRLAFVHGVAVSMAMA